MSIAGDAVGGLALGTDALSAQFRKLAGIVTTPDGVVYVADAANHQIREIRPTGPTSVVAGSGDATSGVALENVPAVAAQLDTPMGLAIDAISGAIIVCDSANHRVRCFAPGGRMYSLAGGGSDPSDTVGAATNARLDTPFGVANDAARNLYFTERGSGRVRRIEPSGRLSTVSTFAPGVIGPIAGSWAGDLLWVGDGGRLRLVRPNQAGATPPSTIYEAPGGIVTGIAYDQAGSVFVAETATAPFGLAGTRILRLRVTPTGELVAGRTPQLIAGTGAQGTTDQDYAVPAVAVPDAATQLLADASYCGLYIDLHAAADPDELSGILFASNAYEDTAAGTRWSQLLRLTPSL